MPLRYHRPDAIHFVTNRCEHEEFLLAPDEELNRTVLVWLARALEHVRYRIKIFGFIFLSNHFHILLRDEAGALADFMDYFQGCLGRAVNDQRGRKGRVWSRAYDDQIVDGDEALAERFAYLHANAVKAGLVNAAADWPGASSLSCVLTRQTLVVEFVDATLRHNLTRRHDVDPRRYTRSLPIPIERLPAWTDLDDEAAARATRALIEAAQSEYHVRRENKPALGLDEIAEREPTDRPANPSHSPRSRFKCSSRERLTELKAAYADFVARYRTAWCSWTLRLEVIALPSTTDPVPWPEYGYPPSQLAVVGAL